MYFATAFIFFYENKWLLGKTLTWGTNPRKKHPFFGALPKLLKLTLALFDLSILSKVKKLPKLRAYRCFFLGLLLLAYTIYVMLRFQTIHHMFGIQAHGQTKSNIMNNLTDSQS